MRLEPRFTLRFPRLFSFPATLNKDMGQIRSYNIGDMLGMWLMPASRPAARDVKRLIYPPRKRKQPYHPLCYEAEFQAWFQSGIRRCDKHAYPYEWHIMLGLSCPKCADEAHQ
jgi:hypothetical protein